MAERRGRRQRRPPREPRARPEPKEWKPRTRLGKSVKSGEIISIDKIFESGSKIREPEIVDTLLPNIKSEIIMFGGSPGKGGGIRRTATRRTVRMHSSGRRFKISALVAVGAPGYLGIGKATAQEHSVAIRKATESAKLNIIPIRRGCGSRQCVCGEAHTIPIKTIGKAGSIRATLLPAPKEVGLCIGDEGKKLLRLAGVRDIWCKILGNTKTRLNYVRALYDAFKYLNKIRGELPEVKEPEPEPVIKEAETKTDEEAEAKALSKEAMEAVAEAVAAEAVKPSEEATEASTPSAAETVEAEPEKAKTEGE